MPGPVVHFQLNNLKQRFSVIHIFGILDIYLKVQVREKPKGPLDSLSIPGVHRGDGLQYRVGGLTLCFSQEVSLVRLGLWQ